jgi:mycothiol synthase
VLAIDNLPKGFLIRAPGHDDAEAVADLMRACDIAAFGEPDTSVEDIRDDWRAPDFELARDAWVLEGSGGAITGFAWLRVRRPEAELDADLYIRPGERVDALAPALLTRIEARARERMGGHDAILWVPSPSVDGAKRALLDRLGYIDARTFFRMGIDLAEPTTQQSRSPSAIEIRRVRIGIDDRAIHATIEDAFSGHFRHAPRSFEEWWAARTSHAQFDPDLWFLAWDGDRVAGALVGYDFVEIGFIRELGVLTSWRGRGVGTALLLHAFETFKARGQLRISLGVDAQNESAVGLYERIGMRVEQRHILMQKQLRA